MDMEFATIRQMLYTVNKGPESPSRRLNQFLMFEQEDDRTAEEVSEDLMRQMTGLMNL